MRSILTAFGPKAMKAREAFNAAALERDPEEVQGSALDVASASQCASCLEIQKTGASKTGVTHEEIAEAVFVAAALRAGPAITHGTHPIN